jgi:hypothetical protein
MMSTRTVLGSTAFGLLVMCGCLAGSASRAKLRSTAASDLKCAPEQVAWQRVDSVESKYEIQSAQGCNRYNIYVWHGEADGWISPLDRASFELSCPREELTVTKISSNTMGVSGCGQKGVYLLTNDGKWILNSSSK